MRSPTHETFPKELYYLCYLFSRDDLYFINIQLLALLNNYPLSTVALLGKPLQPLPSAQKCYVYNGWRVWAKRLWDHSGQGISKFYYACDKNSCQPKGVRVYPGLWIKVHDRLASCTWQSFRIGMYGSSSSVLPTRK